MVHTPIYTTTGTEQTLVAYNNTQPSPTDAELDYEDMIYNYIEEKHITELRLLSPLQLAAAYQRAIEAPASHSSATSESTAYNTIEEDNDLPKVHPFSPYTEEERIALEAALWPTEGPEDDEDTDWTVALSTYDFLGLEEGKHATARVRIPYKVLNHLPEVLEETEDFAEWWDMLREGDQVVNPAAVVVIDIVEIRPLEDRPQRLFKESGVATGSEPESGSMLDGILEGLRGLNEVVV